MLNKDAHIRFWIGTEAELIKLFPIMLEMEKRSIDYDILATGQNPIEKSELLKLLKKDLHIEGLSVGPKKKTTVSLLTWFLATIVKTILQLPKHTNSILLIHGDTISTLMGAIVGFVKGYQIGHIEAGLRSFNFLRPFPEEICRVISSKLVSFHFCPNEVAVKNVEKIKGAKVNTQVNTLYDSLNIFRTTQSAHAQISYEKYFVFVLHRQENIYDQGFVKELTKLVVEKSERVPCVFILHELTRKVLEELGMLEMVKSAKNIKTSSRMPYFEFMNVLSKAEFLITDGGSNQEESYYMGLPCMVMRSETERNEGLGYNVQLAGKDLQKVREYFDNYSKFRFNRLEAKETPSSIIVKFLEMKNAEL